MKLNRITNRVIFSIALILLIYAPLQNNGQDYNHHWLIGYNSGLDTNVISNNAILTIDTNNVTVTPTNFKMPFRAAQGNISDERMVIY